MKRFNEIISSVRHFDNHLVLRCFDIEQLVIVTKQAETIFKVHNVEYVFSHLRMDEYQKLTKTLVSLKKLQILSKKC